MLECDYSNALQLLLRFPSAQMSGSNIVNIVYSSQELRQRYEAKTVTMATTPTLIDSLKLSNDTLNKSNTKRRTVQPWTSYSPGRDSAVSSPPAETASFEPEKEPSLSSQHSQDSERLRTQVQSLQKRIIRLKSRDSAVVKALQSIIGEVQGLDTQDDTVNDKLQGITTTLESICSGLSPFTSDEDLSVTRNESNAHINESSAIEAVQGLGIHSRTKTNSGDIRNFMPMTSETHVQHMPALPSAEKVVGSFKSSIEGFNKVFLGLFDDQPGQKPSDSRKPQTLSRNDSQKNFGVSLDPTAIESRATKSSESVIQTKTLPVVPTVKKHIYPPPPVPKKKEVMEDPLGVGPI